MTDQVMYDDTNEDSEIYYDDGVVRKLIAQYNIATHKAWKHVQGSKHFFKKTQSWGLDVHTFGFLQSRGITDFTIYDDEYNCEYTTTMKEWNEFGVDNEFPGFGRQKFLNVKHWRKTKH